MLPIVPRPRSVFTALTLLLGPFTANALAQTTFTACRVPGVGAIYVVGVAGAPTACLAADHLEFSWTDGAAPGAGSVTGTALADGSVTTSKLADAAVTQAKLDPSITLPIPIGSVGSTELANGGVAAVDIADGAIVAAKIATAAIGSRAVADNSLTDADLAVNSVGSSEIAADAVTINISYPDAPGGAAMINAGSGGISGEIYAASCPNGTVAVGGWWDSSPAGYLQVSASFGTGTSWNFKFSNIGTASVQVQYGAACVSLSM